MPGRYLFSLRAFVVFSLRSINFRRRSDGGTIDAKGVGTQFEMREEGLLLFERVYHICQKKKKKLSHGELKVGRGSEYIQYLKNYRTFWKFRLCCHPDNM